jgi:hypothetical protein
MCKGLSNTLPQCPFVSYGWGINLKGIYESYDGNNHWFKNRNHHINPSQERLSLLFKDNINYFYRQNLEAQRFEKLYSHKK